MLRKLSTLFLTLIPILLFSQDSLKNQENRLVRLIYAQSAEHKQIEGKEFRKVTGPAQFLHNNALIFCDTAIWNVLSNTVDAIGNVRIIQNQTTLFGDRIKYFADRSVAEVRGNLVELVDKDNNKLRTHYLDYYTKDSIALFYNGGSMVNKDGNTIESLDGFFYSKLNKFVFRNQVEMMGDSVEFSADSLAYFTKTDRAVFLGRTNAWQDDGFLKAKGGWYDRKNDLFHFTKDAYIKTKDTEIWADTINYNRKTAEAELFNNIQLLDTAQSAILFADHASFKQKPFKVILTNRPSVATYTVEDGVSDTLFFAADTIRYNTLMKSEVDSVTVALSENRYKESKKDPLGELHKKRPEQKKSSGNNEKTLERPLERKPGNSVPPPDRNTKARRSKIKSKQEEPPIVVEPVKHDTVLVKPISDSTILKGVDSTLLKKVDSTLMKNADSTLLKKADTTTIRFLYANKKVKFFRNNMQGMCDSLLFNSIDSLIRLFKDPVIWTDNNQLSADSIQVIINGGKIKKAEFTSSAFVAIKEDSTHFHQIKSADMVAFFDTGELSRFDAFGGVSSLLFIAEDSIITTMNEKACKQMSTKFSDKSIQKVTSYETIESNAYPIFDLEKDKQTLKGFRWLDSSRPKTRFDISSRVIRSSLAESVKSIAKPTFKQTTIYFGKKKEPEKKADQPNDLPPVTPLTKNPSGSK